MSREDEVAQEQARDANRDRDRAGAMYSSVAFDSSVESDSDNDNDDYEERCLRHFNWLFTAAELAAVEAVADGGEDDVENDKDEDPSRPATQILREAHILATAYCLRKAASCVHRIARELNSLAYCCIEDKNVRMRLRSIRHKLMMAIGSVFAERCKGRRRLDDSFGLAYNALEYDGGWLLE